MLNIEKIKKEYYLYADVLLWNASTYLTLIDSRVNLKTEISMVEDENERDTGANRSSTYQIPYLVP